MSKSVGTASECLERFVAVCSARGAPRVLCLDPGGTTGYAAVWTKPGTGKGALGGGLIGAGQLVGHEYEQLDAVLGMWVAASYCALVVEDFSLRAGLHRGAASKTETLEPVRINAALDYATYRTAVDAAEYGGSGSGQLTSFSSSGAVKRQLPSVAKTLATDARLRTWGLYLPGDHARDAVRHAVLWLHTVGDGNGGSGVDGRALRAGEYSVERIDRG